MELIGRCSDFLPTQIKLALILDNTVINFRGALPLFLLMYVFLVTFYMLNLDVKLRRAYNKFGTKTKNFQTMSLENVIRSPCGCPFCVSFSCIMFPETSCFVISQVLLMLFVYVG